MHEITFKKLILYIYFALVGLTLTGCASRSIVMPSAEKLSSNEVAILKIDKSIIGRVYPQLNGIVDLTKGEIILRSESFKDYHQIVIEPGYYNVMLKVYSDGHIPAFPSVDLRVKSGMTYLFASSIVLNGKAVRAEYKEILTSADKSSGK